MLMFSQNKITSQFMIAGAAALALFVVTGCNSCQPTPAMGCGMAGYSDGMMTDASCNAPMQCATGSCGPGSCGPGSCGPGSCGNGSCGNGGYDHLAGGQASYGYGGYEMGGCGTGGCGSGGCVSGACGSGQCEVPHELRKTAMPEYRIEPTDVILIQSANHIRRASDPIDVGESLFIQCANTAPEEDLKTQVERDFYTIDGMYVIGTDGYVNLGPEFGRVLCAGQPIAEIQRRVSTHMEIALVQEPLVLVTLPDPTTKQIVAGPHLVRSDGTVGLGLYGDVFVAGKSRSEVKAAVEQHLCAYMQSPEVVIDVLGYNSKVYYVIADGAGAGEKVYRLPHTGNETVLDAISRVNGLPSIACKGQIWIARPTPEGCRPDQVLKVDWNAIAQGGQTCTNYQIFPGDRLYVKADPFITFDTNLSKITAPFERILGLTILGNGVVRSFKNSGSGNDF